MKKTIILVLAVWFGTLLMAQNIVGGEYFFDNKKNYGEGTPITLQNPADDISIDLEISVDNLPEGLHRLFVRFKDSNGRWGQTMNYNIFIKHGEVVNIIAGEYFFDGVGAYGEGTALNLSAQASMTEVMQELPVDNLPDGLHRLFVRFKDSRGLWSHTLNFNVFIKHEKLIVIESGEYFFDNIVGYGEGLPIAVDSIANYTTATDFIAAPNNLSVGQHIMYYRFKDSNGLWSHTFSDFVCIGVVDGEYMSDATSYCFGDTVSFDYSGNVTGNATYSWDLNNDGNFSDMQTGGSPFFYIPDVIENDSAIFRYRITSSTLCPSWQKEDSLKVQVSPEIIIGQSITDVKCNGVCDGEVDIIINGGIAPYTYTWSNGSTQEDQDDLCNGMFDVTVTDTIGCTALDSFIIDEPDLLFAMLDLVGNETAGQGNGFIDITTNGGTTPYNFAWSFNNMVISNNEDIEGLSSGMYSIAITDANGCTFTADYEVDNMVNTSTIGLKKYIKIYPNPTKDLLYLQFNLEQNNDMHIELSDNIGRPLIDRVYDNISKNQLVLDLYSYPAGVYVLKIYTDAFILSRRIVLAQ